MPDTRPYDKRVAEQVALLKKHGLEVHIPRRGSVYFKPRRRP